MKSLKLNFIAIISLVVLVVSCKKDEEESVDYLRENLSTSVATYDAASNGTWIEITETEYELLANNLNNTTKSGTTETLFDAVENQSGFHAFTLSNIGYPLPSNSYLFAYKYKLISTDTVTGYKIKIAEGRNDTLFTNVTTLPKHVGAGTKCFLLKGASAKTTNMAYIGFYKPVSVRVGGLWTALTGEEYYYEDGDVSYLPYTFDGYAFYQGLSSTKKQW
ncbi:MAG: hypothetical protein H6553_00470 [Chitinophagales bacterium]|nr:hypothetical protein [Chitinophagales bacterium]